MVRSSGLLSIAVALLSTIQIASAEDVRNVVCQTSNANTYAYGTYLLKVTHWNEMDGLLDIEWQRGNGDLYFTRTTFTVENGHVETIVFFDDVETWGQKQAVFTSVKFSADFTSGMVNMQFKGSKGGDAEDTVRLFCS